MTPPPLYNVEYWYRHESDDDRSVRATCQMSGPANSEADALAEVASLTASGYTVQRVVMQTVCVECRGAGRIGKAPKGTRKAKVSSLPAWRLTWSNCPVCVGQGHTAAATVVG